MRNEAGGWGRSAGVEFMGGGRREVGLCGKTNTRTENSRPSAHTKCTYIAYVFQGKRIALKEEKKEERGKGKTLNKGCEEK